MTCLNLYKKKTHVNHVKLFYLVFKMAFFYTPKIRFEPIIIKAYEIIHEPTGYLYVTFLFIYVYVYGVF